MADLIAVVGPSGSGKSSSMRNLNPKETFVINVAGKQLPFRGWKRNYTSFADNKETGNYIATSNVETIGKVLRFLSAKRSDIKNVVIEDSQYIMSFEAMDRAKEKSFDKFTEIAKNFYDILKAGVDLREDMKVFVFSHDETVGDALNPKRKIKTIGKMLDNMITIEGLFTYVFFTEVVREDDSTKYCFITNSDGITTAKSPMGCFEDLLIDNDLQEIIEKIDEYNEG